MDLELVLQRVPHAFSKVRTPGELFLNGVFWCYTVEDPVREVLGRPVHEWKIPGETAIPADRYLLSLEDSPRFGKDTPTIHGVEGFSGVRMHAGNDHEHTEGCPLVGYELTAEGEIAYGQTRAAVANLKSAIRRFVERGHRCFIDVRNV